MNKLYFLITIMILISVLCIVRITPAIPQEIHKVLSVRDLVRLFPNSVRQIEQQTKQYIRAVKKQIKRILDITDEERTFANTAKALDNISGLSDLAIFAHATQIIELLSPEKELRDAAHDAIVKIENTLIDIFSDKKLYKAFKAYMQGPMQQEALTTEQHYYIEEIMKGFKRGGLELPDDQLEHVKNIKKELAALTLDFDKNIAADNRTLTFTRDELAGLPEDFINALKQTNDGNYIVGIDYPTYFSVMRQATNEQTRKKLYHLFNNRAYPQNEQLLKEIIAKRDQLAKALGFESYAHFELDDQMIKAPARAQQFLDNLLERAAAKENAEYEELMKYVPSHITLTSEGKLQPWDYAFVYDIAKKERYDIDEELIAEYFPVEQTLAGLLSIYESFFSLRFEEVPVRGLWSHDARLLKVFDKKSSDLLGYIILDLYPRANKYSHAAHSTVVPATFDKEGKTNVEVSVIMANFPKAQGAKPPLFKRSDVNTFFHEFGHGLHALLGRTRIATFAGTSVKRDFVEMPSQMLEEWLWDRDILKIVSSHYKTGQELPDDLIDRIMQTKHIATGTFVRRQCLLSLLSLYYFLSGEDKDVDQIYHDLQKQIVKYVAYAPDTHFYTSFGHLSGYGSKYYGYLWSKVFALDLFNEIKKGGLLNPEMGNKYVADVIGRGGSTDPDVLLRNFLGREPNDEAFFKDMGLIS